MKEIEVDGIKYVRKDSVKQQNKSVPNKKGMQYSIVRTYSAGVFAGWIGKVTNKTGRVLNARRIWYWDGAASLSQLSQEGTSKPENCKFPMEVPYIDLTEIIEVLPCTEKAKKSIESVAIWKK